MIKVKDLPASPGYGVSLRCPQCGDTWSATRGDYFAAHPETIMRCGNEDCGRRPLQLVKHRDVYERVQA